MKFIATTKANLGRFYMFKDGMRVADGDLNRFDLALMVVKEPDYVEVNIADFTYMQDRYMNRCSSRKRL